MPQFYVLVSERKRWNLTVEAKNEQEAKEIGHYKSSRELPDGHTFVVSAEEVTRFHPQDEPCNDYKS